MRTIGKRYAVLSAVVLLVACSPPASKRLSATPKNYLSLTVTNHNWLDVAVYAIRGQSRFRLGDVTGNTTRKLRIPENYVVAGAVQLMADPVGSREAYITDAITVGPDEQVQLTVGPKMNMSSYAVWHR